MLSPEEIQKIARLLIAPNKESFELGLSLAQNNMQQLERWLPLLYALKHTSDSSQQKQLESWLAQYVPKPRRDYWERKTIFILWIAQAKGEAGRQKKQMDALYERAKNDFLGDLEIYEPVLQQSYQFSTLYHRLATHFYYEENDYMLATHFALDMYHREENGDALWTLTLLLAFYHYPHQRFLFLQTRIDTWIARYLEQDKTSPDALYFKWVQAMMQKGLGNTAKAVQDLEAILVWLERLPHLLRSGKQLVSFVYFNLSFLYAQQDKLALAKRMYKIGSSLSKEPMRVDARAEIYYRTGKVQRAVHILRKASKQRPQGEFYWYRLSQIYLEQRDLEKAISCLMSCIDHSPQYKRYIVVLMDLLKKSNRRDKILLLEHYQRVVDDIDSSLEELEELV